jgi:hypothetical protein
VSRCLPVDAAWQLLALAMVTGCGGGSVTTASPAPAPAPDRGQPSAPAPEGAKGLVYRPAPATAYRLERHDSLTLQYPGGASQQQVRDRIAFLHVTIGEASAGGSYPLTIVLDSLQARENGMQVDSAALARGTRWTGTLSADGVLSQLQADKAGSLPDELSGRLRLLFPRLPADGVREGMEWTDSSEYRLVADAFPGTEKAITTYRAAESSGSRKAVTLESTGSYARTGTRLQSDQPLQMAATGARHGVHQLGSDGILIAAQGNDSGDMTITVPSVGQTVPVKQSGSFTIALAAPR